MVCVLKAFLPNFFAVSVFTEGVLAMEQTLLGVIRVEPRRILHDGLRKELVRQLCLAMHAELRRPPTLPLDALAVKIDGFRRSVEYVQDYIDIAGLKMWQEEFSRIINYAVEQEANRYLRRKVLDQDSKYQSSVVPIPREHVVIDDHNTTFMGTTLVALLRLTSPANTTFSPVFSAWFASSATSASSSTNKQNKHQRRREPPREVCGVAMFQSIERSLGVAGLIGLDRLLGLKIVHELARLVDDYKAQTKPLASFFERLRQALQPTWLPVQDAPKLYSATAKKLEKVCSDLFIRIRAVGHAQLLRRALKHTLQLRSRLDANGLYQALKAVDQSLLGDIHDAYLADAAMNDPDHSVIDNPKLLTDLASLLDASGFTDPYEKIYLATSPLDAIPEALLFLILSYGSKLDYDKQLATLAKRKAQFPIDGVVLLVGCHTLLKQFHPGYTKQLIEYLAQFVNSTVNTLASQVQDHHSLPLELVNTVWFVENLCKIANIPLPADFIPIEVLAARTANAN